MNFEQEKWQHLDEYERKYLRKVIEAYEAIMQTENDVEKIASRYQLDIQAVQRAKDYAFGSGVPKYQFSPDPAMLEAWKRLALGTGTIIDQVFLKHEMYESNLVINQGMNQAEAHQITQKIYPWSDLLNQHQEP